jgi:hypothetical protein
VLHDRLIVRFRVGGREHTLYDAKCAGCERGDSAKRWPRPHRDFGGSSCLGLVHAEKFVNPVSQETDTIVWCDVCGTNPRVTQS